MTKHYLFFDDPPISAVEWIAVQQAVPNVEYIVAVSGSLLGDKNQYSPMANIADLMRLLDRPDIKFVNHTYNHDNFKDLNILEKLNDLKYNKKFLRNYNIRLSGNIVVVPRGDISVLSTLILWFLGYKLFGTEKNRILYRLGFIRKRVSIKKNMHYHSKMKYFYTHDISNSPSVYGCSIIDIRNFLGELEK